MGVLAKQARAALLREPPIGMELLCLDRRVGVASMDPLRMTVLSTVHTRIESDEEVALSGFALDEALIGHGVYAELPELGSVTFAISSGSRRHHTRRLLRALHAVA